MSAPLFARAFPRAMRLGGRLFPLRWQFRDCAPIILAFEDEALTAQEQQLVLLARLFPEPPPDLSAALPLALSFLDGGQEEAEGRAEGADDEEPPWRLWSLTRDGPLIYSGFRHQYGIDLQQDELHWWSFLALFRDLDPEGRFYQLLRLRQGYLEGTLSREELAAFQRMGPSALPPPQPGDRVREEQARAFLTLLEGGDGNG